MARFDFRMDDDLLERVRKIAEDVFKAPKHHITGKAQVTDTLNKIIEIGVTQIESGNYQDTSTATLPDSYLDTFTDKILERVRGETMGKIDRLEYEIERLSQALQSGLNTDKDTDTNDVAIADDPLPSTGINRESLSPIFDDGESTQDGDKEPKEKKRGLTNKELSEKTGTPKGTISPWKTRGRDKVQTAKDGSRWVLGADDRWHEV